MPTDNSVLALEQTWQQQLLLQSKRKTRWFCNNQTSSTKHDWEEQGTEKIIYTHIQWKDIVQYLSIRRAIKHKPDINYYYPLKKIKIPTLSKKCNPNKKKYKLNKENCLLAHSMLPLPGKNGLLSVKTSQLRTTISWGKYCFAHCLTII